MGSAAGGGPGARGRRSPLAPGWGRRAFGDAVPNAPTPLGWRGPPPPVAALGLTTDARAHCPGRPFRASAKRAGRWGCIRCGPVERARVARRSRAADEDVSVASGHSIESSSRECAGEDRMRDLVNPPRRGDDAHADPPSVVDAFRSNLDDPSNGSHVVVGQPPCKPLALVGRSARPLLQTYNRREMVGVAWLPVCRRGRHD